MAEMSVSPTSSDSTQISINDCEFCMHGKETCAECGNVDFRDDNSFALGVEPNDRAPLEISITHSKDGEIICKKHKSATCSTCFAFKKQIQRLAREAKKGKK